MRTKDLPFQFVRAETLAGKSPDGLVTWVENFMTLLKPDNGIEYVAKATSPTDHRPLREIESDLAAKAEGRIYDVRPAVYVNHGNSEGLRICVDLLVKSQRQSLLFIKTFSTMEEAWFLAQKLSIVLELVLLHGEEPVIVDAVNVLGIKRYRQRETLFVQMAGELTLRVGEASNREVKYSLHADPVVMEIQRAAIESDLAFLVRAYGMQRVDASILRPSKVDPLVIGGINFADVSSQ